jgi:hypothetical protein
MDLFEGAGRQRRADDQRKVIKAGNCCGAVHARWLERGIETTDKLTDRQIVTTVKELYGINR